MTDWGRDGQDRGSPPLPDEIAFLRLFGVEERRLRAAAATARASGVTADLTLLNEGHLSAPVFYELLARHLGVPYMRRPLRIAADVRLDQAAAIEIARLAPNPAGLDYVLAPRGKALALLLRQFAARAWSGDARVAITTPQRLAALVRLSHRGTIVREASHALPNWNASLSAHGGWDAGQILVALAIAAASAYVTWLAPTAALLALCLICSLVFLAMVAVRLAATAYSPDLEAAGDARRSDESLPVYSVVVPLYRESRVVRRLVGALSRLDYPAAKLDIKIVVEADDPDTLYALERQRLPARFEILMAPAGRPRTKPRALNVALRFTTGTFLVVYDAEDDPEPNQLRVAVDHFERAGPRLGCLQARLAIDNAEDSWLTRGIMAQVPQAWCGCEIAVGTTPQAG